MWWAGVRERLEGGREGRREGRKEGKCCIFPLRKCSFVCVCLDVGTQTVNRVINWRQWTAPVGLSL